MNVVNGHSLLGRSPIVDMLDKKHTCEKTGVSYGLVEAGYDIRIKQAVHFKPPLYHFSGTQVRPGLAHVEGFDPKYGNFALASAIEEFTMPTDLVGIVHDKSTWARKGLSVLNTVIEPGWNGHLTLELIFNGDEELIIPAGTGIAQVIFHQIAHQRSYQGTYQHQEDRPVRSLVDQN